MMDHCNNLRKVEYSRGIGFLPTFEYPDGINKTINIKLLQKISSEIKYYQAIFFLHP